MAIFQISTRPFRLPDSNVFHLMRHRSGKYHHEIRRADASPKIDGTLRKYLTFLYHFELV